MLSYYLLGELIVFEQILMAAPFYMRPQCAALLIQSVYFMTWVWTWKLLIKSIGWRYVAHFALTAARKSSLLCWSVVRTLDAEGHTPHEAALKKGLLQEYWMLQEAMKAKKIP